MTDYESLIHLPRWRRVIIGAGFGLLLAAVIAPSVSGSPHDVDEVFWVQKGFYAGESFLSLTPNEKRIYASGIVDGLFASAAFSAKSEKMALTKNCIEGMTDSQLAAILEKFLRDNPSRWNADAGVSMVSALIDICPSLSGPS